MEMTAGLAVQPVTIQTPLVKTESLMIKEKVAVVPILRFVGWYSKLAC